MSMKNSAKPAMSVLNVCVEALMNAAGAGSASCAVISPSPVAACATSASDGSSSVASWR
ncbi:hypothetical protein WEH80_21610 [Actinomycetes bacterium KLBMP 9759]